MLPVDWRSHFSGGRFRGLCASDHSLAPLTTLRIGGTARVYLEPADTEELVESVSVLRRIGMPFRILGGGSNLLVGDKPIDGAVISLNRLNAVGTNGPVLVAEAGTRLIAAVRAAGSAGLSGTECLAGIPGRIGGAIFGNAGGKHGDIGSRVVHLELLTRDGEFESFEPPASFFRYRKSAVGDRIVLRAWLRLDESEPSTVRGFARAIIKERRQSQPGWVGNAGCVFKNPAGDSAGRLIDAAGCRNTNVGAARVSDIHANFIENDGGASAADVLALIDRVRTKVSQVHHVDLKIEVRRWLT